MFKVSLILIALINNASCSGSFFKRLSNTESKHSVNGMQNVVTQEFHDCSLENVCNTVSSNVIDDSTRNAPKTEDHTNADAKKEIWKKDMPDFSSCKEAYEAGIRQESSLVTLAVNGKQISVLCDMSDGDGWIIFQKRTSSDVSFERNWESYRKGFGGLLGNFWLGLDALHEITSSGGYTLRVDLQNFKGSQGYAEYSDFRIGSHAEKFVLTYGSFSGTIGDGMDKCRGKPFSTPDQDNRCAIKYHSGWWFDDCYRANLNALYRNNNSVTKFVTEEFSEYMTWNPWNWKFGTIKISTMKIRK